MGIDYVVAKDCAAKEALGVEGIISLVKARSRAEAIIEMAREKGDTSPPSKISFVVALMRNGKVTQENVTAQSLLDQAAELDEHKSGCAACPANRGSEAGFGCYNSIPYPLAVDTEQMMLDMLPDDLSSSSAAGYLFAQALKDFAWSGEKTAAMRKQGDTFFVSRAALKRTWPGGVTVTSDQVFHMLFHVGHIGTEHALMVCMFYGLVQVGEGGGASKRPKIESPNARRMADFMNALAFAASEKLDVLIDG
jgi:hypothetical protein